MLEAFGALPAPASAASIGRSASPPIWTLLLVPGRLEGPRMIHLPILFVVPWPLHDRRLPPVLGLLAHRAAAVQNWLVAAGLRIKKLPVRSWGAVPPRCPAKIVCRNLLGGQLTM